MQPMCVHTPVQTQWQFNYCHVLPQPSHFFFLHSTPTLQVCMWLEDHIAAAGQGAWKRPLPDDAQGEGGSHSRLDKEGGHVPARRRGIHRCQREGTHRTTNLWSAARDAIPPHVQMAPERVLHWRNGAHWWGDGRHHIDIRENTEDRLDKEGNLKKILVRYVRCTISNKHCFYNENVHSKWIFPNAMISKISILLLYFIFRSPGNYLAVLRTPLHGQQMSATRSGKWWCQWWLQLKAWAWMTWPRGSRSGMKQPANLLQSFCTWTETAAVPTPWSSRSGRTCLSDLTSGTSWGGLRGDAPPTCTSSTRSWCEVLHHASSSGAWMTWLGWFEPSGLS